MTDRDDLAVIADELIAETSATAWTTIRLSVLDDPGSDATLEKDSEAIDLGVKAGFYATMRVLVDRGWLPSVEA